MAGILRWNIELGFKGSMIRHRLQSKIGYRHLLKKVTYDIYVMADNWLTKHTAWATISMLTAGGIITRPLKEIFPSELSFASKQRGRVLGAGMKMTGYALFTGCKYLIP